MLSILIGVLAGNGLVAFLLVILVIAVIVYALQVLFGFLNVPQPIRTLIWLIVGVIIVLYLLNRFAGIGLT